MGILSKIKSKITGSKSSSSVPNFDPKYVENYTTAQIDPDRMNEVAGVCKTIILNTTKYKTVSEKTGVPWKLLACLHYREASCRFSTCLHNGDPLPGPTKHVPKGRGPFKSWEEAAIDAIMIEKNKFPAQWDLLGSLSFAEAYNGLGYKKRGVLSPYIWAGTNKHNERGKYTSDGIYDPNAREGQLGVVALLKYLENYPN